MEDTIDRMTQLESDIKILKGLNTELVKRIKALEDAHFMMLTADWSTLTPPQIICLQYAVIGLTTKQIAEKINRTPSTVRQHFVNSFKLLGVSSKAEAIYECRRRGLLVTPEHIAKQTFVSSHGKHGI